MKLKKNVIAFAMAAVLAVSTVSLPMTAKAEVSNGTYETIVIDTFAVPTDNEDIAIKTDANGKYIEASKNVKFDLNSTIDVTWSVSDGSNKKNYVSVDESGLVRIDEDADAGTYTVTATPKNITNASIKYETPSIRIKVTTETATVSSVKLDAEAINEHPQMKVTEENGVQTLTVDGVVKPSYVDGSDLPVIIEPEYINDTDYYLDNADHNNVYFELDRKAARSYDASITTKKVTTKTGKMNAYVSPNLNQPVSSFNVVVKPVKFTFDVSSTSEKDIAAKYKFVMNQYAELEVQENSLIALENLNTTYDTVEISNINWTLKQDDKELVANPDGSYDVMGYVGHEPTKFASIMPMDAKHFVVVTEDEAFENAECKDVKMMASYDKNGETVPAAKTITLVFDPESTDAVSSVDLDFETYGPLDEAYAIYEEEIDNVKTPVYYFESTGAILDLVEATMGNKLGVKSFELSKQARFANQSSAKYQISYQLSDVNVAKAYQNKGINEVVDSNGFVPNGKLELTGIGYKKLTVSINNPYEYKASKSYIIRTVSSTNNLDNGYTFQVKRHGSDYYNLAGSDVETKEVVHVRRGEAITPTINNAPVSRVNPYLSYSFDPTGIANSIINEDGEYVLTGLKSGKVFVTATGTVDKSDVITFAIYVNGESYTTDTCNYIVDFFEAVEQNKVKVDGGNFIILGKQDEVPVNVKLAANSGNAGIPDIIWSLEDVSDEYATINAETGVITTKKATGSKKFTVRATSATNSNIFAEATFTIESVYAKTIDAFAEKLASGDEGVLTAIDGINGTVEAGKKFQLYATKFSPANATTVDGEIEWTSGDPEIATVTSSGLVTAKKAGSVKLTAEYTSDAKTMTTIYNLTVTETEVKATAIDAKNITLTRIAETAAINATVLPENTKDKTLTYSSDKEDVVTVSENGQVTAVSVGTATITIKTANGIEKKITVTVQGLQDKPADTTANKTAAINAVKAALGTNPSAAAKAAADKAIAQINAASNVDEINAAKTAGVAAVTKQVAADKAAADKVAADKAAADKAAADKFKASKAKMSSAKNSKSKKIVVKIKKLADAEKYEVSYATKKNFKGAKKKVTAKTTYTISKLKKGKTYYVRVRGIKTVAGTKVYSKYSKAKKVVIKK